MLGKRVGGVAGQRRVVPREKWWVGSEVCVWGGCGGNGSRWGGSVSCAECGGVVDAKNIGGGVCVKGSAK